MGNETSQTSNNNESGISVTLPRLRSMLSTEFDNSNSRAQEEWQAVAAIQQKNSGSIVGDIAINKKWFDDWRVYASGKTKFGNNPGKIDNTLLDNGNGMTRNDKGWCVDYYCIHQDIWNYFINIYGGGPKLIARTNTYYEWYNYEVEKSKHRCHFSYCSDAISKQFSNLEVSQEMEYTIFNKHYKAIRLNYGCIQTTNTQTGTIHYFDRRGYKPGPRKLLFPPNTSIATPISAQLETPTQITTPQMSNENEKHGHVTKNQAEQQIMISNTVSQNKNNSHENRSRDMDNVNNEHDHESKNNYREVNNKQNKTHQTNTKNNTHDNNSMENQVSFETFGSPRSISSSSPSGSSVTHCSDNENNDNNNKFKFNDTTGTSNNNNNNKLYREFLEEKTSFEASMDSDRYRIIQIDRIDTNNHIDMDINSFVHDEPDMIKNKSTSVTVSAECYKAALTPLFSEPAVKSPRGDIVLTTNYLQNDGTYQERLYHGGSWESLHKIVNNGRLLNDDFEKQNVNDKNIYFSRAAKFSHYHTDTNDLNQYCLLSCSVLIGKYKNIAISSSDLNCTQSMRNMSMNNMNNMNNNIDEVFEISKEYQCTPRYKIVYVWRPY